MIKRKYLKFSLRTALIAVTLLCLVIGVWTYRARRQAYFVHTLFRERVDVGYPFTNPRWWWLEKFLPRDYYNSPSAVSFTSIDEMYLKPKDRRQDRITKIQIDVIKKLPSVTSIDLSYTDIDDQKIDFIYDMPNIQSLELRNTNVTYEKCQEIQRRLQNIEIYYE